MCHIAGNRNSLPTKMKISTLHSQYHGYWWSWGTWNLGIIHGIDLNCQQYFSLSTRRVNASPMDIVGQLGSIMPTDALAHWVSKTSADMIYWLWIKEWKLILKFVKPVAPNSLYTRGECPHPQQMEVSAPTPKKCVINLWKTRQTLIWQNWSESQMVFIFTLAVLYLFWWTN